jgi:hypothetical protein
VVSAYEAHRTGKFSVNLFSCDVLCGGNKIHSSYVNMHKRRPARTLNANSLQQANFKNLNKNELELKYVFNSENLVFMGWSMRGCPNVAHFYVYLNG